MQDYIKKFKKIIVLLCISIIAGGVIMGGYAGIHYIKAGDNKGKHSIDNSKIEIRGNIKEKNGKYIVSDNILINSRMNMNPVSFQILCYM
jgi:hypothetical protein